MVEIALIAPPLFFLKMSSFFDTVQDTLPRNITKVDDAKEVIKKKNSSLYEKSKILVSMLLRHIRDTVIGP